MVVEKFLGGVSYVRSSVYSGKSGFSKAKGH